MTRGKQSLKAASYRIQNSAVSISRLPTEILEQIFEIACLHSGYEGSSRFGIWEDWNPLDPMKEMRVAIMLTCWRWKTVAQDAPALWRQQYFVVKLGTAEEDVLPYVDVSRSATVRLQVHVTGASMDDVAATQPQEILQLAFPRCDYLSYDLTRGATDIDPILKGVPMSFPHLRKLTFGCAYMNSDNHSEQVLDLSMAPLLHTLSIRSSFQGPVMAREVVRVPKFRLPSCSMITRLSLSGRFDCENVAEMLECCPRLRVLRISAEMNPICDHNHSLTLASLTHLVIDGCRSGVPSWPQFDCPRLETLEICQSECVYFVECEWYPNLRHLVVALEEKAVSGWFVEFFLNHPKLEYVATTMSATYPATSNRIGRAALSTMKQFLEVFPGLLPALKFFGTKLVAEDECRRMGVSTVEVWAALDIYKSAMVLLDTLNTNYGSQTRFVHYKKLPSVHSVEHIFDAAQHEWWL